MLSGSNIFLRELHSTDVDVMLKWENDQNNWKVSGTRKLFAKAEIEVFVNSKHDLIQDKQIRYVICLNDSGKPIGTIDLFEFDAAKKAVGIGVLIAETPFRNKGFATETLMLMVEFCRNELKLVNLFCNIQKDNSTSIRLFEKFGFQFIEERLLEEELVNYYELNLLSH
ncbi:MAG: GNAT family N-acetyltransferase [Vicingaceae bacterium]|nr:GNAT family N-acetyltransferase [Vicingaceae bacterium]